MCYLHHQQQGHRMPGPLHRAPARLASATPVAARPALALPAHPTMHCTCLQTGQLTRVLLAGRPLLATCTGREQLLSRGCRPVADSPDMASCTLYSPVSTSALRVVMPSAPAAMLRALQPGPHLCTQSCYAICARCNAATLGATRGRCQSSTPDAGEYVAHAPPPHPSTTRSGLCQSTPARVNTPPPPHPPAWTICPEAAPRPVPRGRRLGRSPEIVRPCTRAVARADALANGRVVIAVWSSAGFVGRGFFCRVVQGLFQEHRGPSRPGTKWS
jgi:hypothetical protein